MTALLSVLGLRAADDPGYMIGGALFLGLALVCLVAMAFGAVRAGASSDHDSERLAGGGR